MKKVFHANGFAATVAVALVLAFCPITFAQEPLESDKRPSSVQPKKYPDKVPEPEHRHLTLAERKKLLRSLDLARSQRMQAQGAPNTGKKSTLSARLPAPASNKETGQQQAAKKPAAPAAPLKPTPAQ